MITKQSDLSAFGKAQTEGMLNLQKELLETYEQASRAWLDRVRSEVELWSRLGAKLTATRSVPEAMVRGARGPHLSPHFSTIATL